ncbi:MAG: uracil-DNA glycosylase [Thaumarchaeota archaeon]|nr:uracil-DNA glycosylase [Nitrososphaerota archaeon]
MSSAIDSIKNSVISCMNCDLSRSRINAVPGEGDWESDVIFVGEAPGRNEDLQGAPFVGAAGKILSEALEYAGFTRRHVYITNVVKCRPPNNRRPSKQEVSSCSGYLQKEIGIIKPTVICILGNTAFGSLLDGSEITKNRGKLIRREDHLYFVTVHPAAVLYNPDLRQVLKDDLKSLYGIVEKIKKGTPVQISE